MGEHKADKLLNFSLLLFAASCILSISAAEAAIILMLAAILWKAFTSPDGFAQPIREFHANPLVFPLALYLISYIFSSIFSLDPAHSFSRLNTEVLKALSAVVVFSAVARAGREKAAAYFIAGASGSALIGLYQFVVGLGHITPGELARAHGTMIAVTYAEVTGLALMLAITLLPNSQGVLRKLYAAASIVLSLGFAASLSRGPALGLLLALATVLAAGKSYRKPALGALAIVLLIFGMAVALNKANRAKLTSVANFLAQTQPASKLDYAANVRTTMWKAGIKIFQDYPLTGTGPYALRKVFNYYHHKSVDLVIDYPDVHNLYLQRAADMGVPGLLALLLLFWTILKTSALSFRKYRDSFSLWGLAAFSGFLAMMLTDSSFDLPRVSFCIYLLAALSGPADTNARTSTQA